MSTHADSSTLTRDSGERIPLARIALATVVAAVVATAANAFVYYLGDGVGAFPDDVTVSSFDGSDGPLGIGDVIASTVLFLVVAGIVFAIISRVSSQPLRVFTYVALGVLVLSLAMPFSIADAPGDMLVALLLMHFVAGAIGIWVLTRLSVPAR